MARFWKKKKKRRDILFFQRKYIFFWKEDSFEKTKTLFFPRMKIFFFGQMKSILIFLQKKAIFSFQKHEAEDLLPIVKYVSRRWSPSPPLLSPLPAQALARALARVLAHGPLPEEEEEYAALPGVGVISFWRIDPLLWKDTSSRRLRCSFSP